MPPTAAPPPSPREGRLARLRRAPATAALLAVLAIAFVVGLARPDLVALLLKDAPAIRDGQVWRLVTAGFLHAGLMHLAVNSLALYAVGPTVEQLYGRAWLWLFFVLGGTAGFAASTVFDRGPSLGASAGLFALLGVLLAFPFRARDRLRPEVRRALTNEILSVAALNLAFGFMAPQLAPGLLIDNAAHVGGFASGILLGLAVPPRELRGRRREA